MSLESILGEEKIGREGVKRGEEREGEKRVRERERVNKKRD